MATKELVQQHVVMGARFVLHSSDMTIMNSTFRRIRAELRSVGIRFSPTME